MTYDIELLPAAQKQLNKLPEAARKQVSALIDSLAEDPRPHGYKQLKGSLKDSFRVRTGNYRVIYSIHDKHLIVLVVKIGDRKNVY